MRQGLTALFVCLISSVWSQSVRFVAATDAKQIVQDNYFQVSFTLENANGQGFQAPAFDDFDVVGGPSQSTQMTIINGRTSQKLSYSYVLTSSKPGRYTLGSARIIVDGKEYKTEPITIEVIKGNNAVASSASNTNILELLISHDTAFIGQQVTLSYVLLTTEDVRSYDFSRLPEVDGFYRQALDRVSPEAERVVRNGVQYVSRMLGAFALFPQKKGTFTIPSTTVELGISEPGARTNFFFNTRLRQARVGSEPVTIHIAELPADAPTSFCGAVGDFYLGTSVDKNSITMDDAINLTLQIRGFGDPKFIEAPKQPFTADFEIYEPNLLAEEAVQQNNKIQVTKTYEYLLLPKRTGTINFQPEMSFYNPDSGTYERVMSQEYSVNVLQGSNRTKTDLASQRIELPPIYATSHLKSPSKPFVNSIGYWILNGICVLALMSLFVYHKVVEKRESIDIKDIRQKRARKIALHQLSAAKDGLLKGDIQKYYIELRVAVLQYLADKLKLDTKQLSKADIAALLEEHLLQELTPSLMTLLQRGEQALYAALTPDNAHADYEMALGIIEGIELSRTVTS